MKKKLGWIICGVFTCVFAWSLAAADASWKTAVTDGSYTNDANWSTSAFPTSNETAFFDLQSVTLPASGEYRVSFEGDVTTSSRMCVRNIAKDVPLVFAVTNGASWYMGPGSMYNTYGINLSQVGGQTGDNLSIRPASNNMTEPCFLMSNALLSYTINGDTGNHIVFSKGLWNWYDPSGNEADSPANTMYVCYGGNNQIQVPDGTRFDVAADATLRGRDLIVSQHTMAIAGGDHTLFGKLSIGNLTAGTSTVFAVNGGTVFVSNTVPGEAGVYIGAKALSNRSIDNTQTHAFAVAGTASVDVTVPPKINDKGQDISPAATLLTDQMYAHSRLTVSDSATYRTRGFLLGNAASSTLAASAYLAQVLVENDATFITWKGGTVGSATSGSLTLKDNALFEQEGDNSLGFFSYNKLLMSDSSRFLAGGPVTFGGTGDIVIEGNAVFKTVASARGTVVGNGHRLTIGESGSTKRIRLTVRDNAQLRQFEGTASTYIYGDDTLISLEGGVSEWPQAIVYGGLSSGDCRIRVSGGTHHFGTVEGKSDNWSTSVGAANDKAATLEVAGGTLRISTGSALYAANCNTGTKSAQGRIELKGGVLVGKIQGGSSAAAKNGNGRAEFYANGGTLQAPNAAAASFVEKFDEAVLGEKGLVFESAVALPADDKSGVDVKQAFTDETGKTGRFIKTGSGAVRLYNTSTHGETAVAGGTAKLMTGVTQFGRSLVVTNGSTLIASGSITAERLTLGDDATAGTISIPAEAVVTLTGDNAFSAPNGRIDYAPASTKGIYTIFRLTGTVDRSAFLRVSLAQSSATLHYAFQFAEDGDDTLVQLVTYTDEDVSDVTWQGTSSVFETPGNWQGGAAPAVTNAAVFPASAAVKDVTIGQQTTIDNMVFAGGEYTIRGNNPLKVFGFTVSGGTADVLAPLFAVGSLALDVAAGTELTLEGTLDGNFAASKTGKGQLTVVSETSTAKSDWTLSGGITEFAHSEAIGAGDVTLGRATVRFTGEGETDAGITVDAGAGQAAVIDMATNVTFNGGFTTVSGGTLKKGAGALNVNFPAGTYDLAKDDLGVGRNAIPGNNLPIIQPVPVDGEVVNTDGLGGFTVCEGVVRLTGAGKDKTTIRQDHWTLVGAKYTNDVAEAELELANLKFDNSAGDFRRVYVGYRPYGTYLNPRLRVIDDAFLRTHGVLIGGDDGATDRHWYPSFEVTNASAQISTTISAGRMGRWELRCHPTVRVLAGADVSLSGGGTSAGLEIGGNADVLIDGGVMRMLATGGGVIIGNTSSGSVRLQNGGTLSVPSIRFNNTGSHQSTTNFFLTVDGGTLELTVSNDLVIPDAQKRQVVMGENGGTVCVSNDCRYVFRFPIKGAGALVKTGGGELVIGTGKDREHSAYSQGAASLGEIIDSGLVTGQWTGLTTVSEGKLTFEETSSVAERSFVVADGAMLDLGGYAGALTSVSGGGMVTNATVIGLKIAAARPDETPLVTELNVVLSGRVTVDFGVPKIEEVTRPSGPVPVAKLGAGIVFNAGAWKAKNCGKGNTATFTCVDGIVYATFCNSFGLTVIVR